MIGCPDDEECLYPGVLMLCHPSSIHHPPTVGLYGIMDIFDDSRKCSIQEEQQNIRRRLVPAVFWERESLIITEYM